MPDFKADIVLDSVGANGARITTMLLTYPRFVHEELLTHRLFSRNAASSRAIPIANMIKQVEENPALPVWWGATEKGMQARVELEGSALRGAQALWSQARRGAVSTVRELAHFGLHKQLSNRLLHPWQWMMTLVTGTEWSNFFALRDHEAAQPEMRQIAILAMKAMAESTPQELADGEWHLPFMTDVPAARVGAKRCIDMSAGRCARLSYLTHDQRRAPEEDIARAKRLLVSGHMSPFEHQARACSEESWQSYANDAALGWIERRVPVGNFWGWIQYRKMLDNEYDFSLWT